jgi:hypothetical protein
MVQVRDATLALARDHAARTWAQGRLMVVTMRSTKAMEYALRAAHGLWGRALHFDRP